LIALSLSLPLCACAAGAGGRVSQPEIKAERRADGTIVDDKSLCVFKDLKNLEVSETAGPGAIQPNVRRVFRVFGTGSLARKVLMCREIDTNLDGFKDVARTYDDDGQSKEERADTNYDGKIDTWNLFVKGRLAEVKLDQNHDGAPDEWKIYIDGKLSRIKRDTNFDGQPDVWEMYRKGRLERMGRDLTSDKRVDQWLYDTEWRRQLKEERERQRKEDERKRKADAEKRRKEAEAAAAKVLGGE
jgi:hypothetical protein